MNLWSALKQIQANFIYSTEMVINYSINLFQQDAQYHCMQ